MELEVKYLAPYLPYKIKGRSRTTGTIFTITGFNDRNSITTYGDLGISDFKGTQLLLRQLSCLSEEIEVNGQKFIPIVELLKFKYSNWYKEKEDTRYAKIDFDNTSAWFSVQANFDIKVIFFKDDIFSYPDYWIIQKLAEWHIDFQCLIGKGLAVDINTLSVE